MVGVTLTQGAVVVRECGLPAEAGIDRAAVRLQAWDLIKVDGQWQN